VEGNASLTPSGGFMSLTYVYDTASLLGSSALGQFQFNFFEDPGFGLQAHIEGQASFLDYHTGTLLHPTVLIQSGSLDNQIAFGADLTVTSFIGGCASSPCDLTNGVFTDTQSLSALIDPASNGSVQGLNSLDTFRVSLTSDLPFVSADGRTSGAASAVPEPRLLSLLTGAILFGGVWSAQRQKSRTRSSIQRC